MDVGESLRMSARTVRSHPLRSTLTTLGIVIGIAAVITFVTLGASLQTEILGQFGASQVNRIYVTAAPSGQGSGPVGFGGEAVFTEHDLGQLRSLEGVGTVVPQGSIPTSGITRGNDTVATGSVTATTPAAFRSVQFAAGGPYEENGSGVVVNRAAAGQFSGNLSVGDRVTVSRRTGEPINVTVVGIMAEGESLSPIAGFDTGPQFYLPTRSYDQVIRSPTTGKQQRVYPLVTVSAENPGDVAAVQDRVESALENSDASQLAPPGYGITVRTNEEIVRRVGQIVDRLTAFVTGIAVISLLVGAIGIANIMLVSVRERTREIGIMKAVGATNRDVLQLFLVEAVLLGILGAVVGTPVGVAGGWIATQYAELPLTVPPIWVGVAISIGLVVGVIAGLYPAWSAARVDPIEALRHE
ncbi:MAG: ABC transporter permease [Haloarculaceae archaeon]